jgi:hypothetical protein
MSCTGKERRATTSLAQSDGHTEAAGMGSRHAGDEVVGSRSDLQRRFTCPSRTATTGAFSPTQL